MKPNGWARPPLRPGANYAVAVDPGLECTAYSLWHMDPEGAELVRAGFLRPADGRGPAAWRNIASALAVETYVLEPVVVVCETMQLYARGKGGPGVADDLLELQGIAGAIFGCLRGIPYALGVLPSEWKGQVPKAVTLARVEEFLESHPGLELRVTWPSKALRHNVADAIGIGLHAFGL